MMSIGPYEPDFICPGLTYVNNSSSGLNKFSIFCSGPAHILCVIFVASLGRPIENIHTYKMVHGG